ncbi:hypothetical protein CAPTEDRAFT_200064 [Capitella teleta]|uniref:Uncharacterized protein n=1 Tax=Capitella teleta TaxID=283909 RepID=R7TQN4_CAPTE|nr:hypothetical protein CAPTEDRAFT_200064 [Capitella teleta]|eukprot:ELT95867.1 hypothetical protein CAPTEDRAFT_200064 [Capitella teleta]
MDSEEVRRSASKRVTSPFITQSLRQNDGHATAEWEQRRPLTSENQSKTRKPRLLCPLSPTIFIFISIVISIIISVYGRYTIVHVVRINLRVVAYWHVVFNLANHSH